MARTAVVGRDAELGRVAAFARSLLGGPTALVLEGEAGAGKTTLWEEALDRTADLARTVSCRPVQSEMALSYAALGDLVGDALPGLLVELPAPQRRALEVALRLEEAGGGSTDHRAVAAGLLSLLVALARERPLIIAIDDLQWLDRSSARSLGFAFRRLSTEPIALLATLRKDPGSPSAPELTDLLGDRRAQRLHVGPLSVGAIQHLLADRLDLTLPRTALLYLHETARGNPFFAIELGRALVEADSLPGPGEPLPVPGDLQALLVKRIRRLPAAVREALLLAALLPEPHEHVLATALGGGWTDAASRARRDGIIEVRGTMVRFVHPLLAAVVAGEASDAERRDAHRRLADSTDDAAERARHLALAATGPDEGVAAVLEEAAREATRRGAPDTAAELAELARKLTPDDRPRDVCRRSTIAGDASFAAGDSVRAVELFTEASAVAASGSERGDALWRLGRVRYHHDNIAASRAILEEARGEASHDDALRAAIDHDLAYPCFAMGDLRATLHHAKAAVESGERSGAVHILADARAQVAVAEFLLGRGVQWELMDRARALEDWDEPRPALLRPTIAVAHILGWADRIDDARALLEEAERKLLERGDDGALPFLRYHMAELDCWSGDWARGHERALEADRIASETSQHGTRTLTCYAVGLLAAHLGRVDEARAYIDEGVRMAAATGHVIGGGSNLAILGFLELSLGHPDRAHALFDRLIAGARVGGFDEPGSAWWLADEIEALIALGEQDQAVELTGWLEERARAIDLPTGLATAARCRALLLAAAGRTDDALAACDEALAQHDRVRIPFRRGRTLFVKGQIARRARKWGVARASLEAALDVFEELGAALWSDRSRDELARVGGRRAAPTELSESERQIADLVAAGRSNKEAAAALCLSPRTVSASLGRVYRKLGVTTRTEMAARLRTEAPCD